jgi:hypothetical protein
MRPVRTIITVVFAAAVAVTGCAAHPTAGHPSAAPAPPVAAAPAAAVPVPARQPTSKQPTPAPVPPRHPNGPIVDYAPRPVLADGHYDAYIRTVDASRNRLVVDLVQVFHDQAAVDAAIADGKPRAIAQYLSVYVSNHNSRLRTLPLARDLRLDLLSGDCEAPISTKLSTLVAHARTRTWYYNLTVAGGAVHRIQEILAINAC